MAQILTNITVTRSGLSETMSGPTFNSPFGANSNPFGSSRIDTGVMQRVAEEDENDTVTSPTTPHFGTTTSATFRGPFGGDATFDPQPSGVRSPPNPEGYPAQYNFGRRTSVSAESLKPVADSYDNWTPPYHPKTPEQLERLKKAISGNFLFSHLDEEQSAQILGALVEKPIPAKGIKVGCHLVIMEFLSSLIVYNRSSLKAMPVTISMLSKRARLMYMSTALDHCSQDRRGWDKRWALLRLEAHLESWPSCIMPPELLRSSLLSRTAHSGPWTASHSGGF
jgi:hypothetical protein